MIIRTRTNITLLILGAAIFLLFFLMVSQIFRQIKIESGNLIIQKKELLESEAKIKNLQNFAANFKRYQENLEKIDRLFADSLEPIEFIEFLESEAASSGLSIEIAPPKLKEKDNKDPWPTLEFSLNLKGYFPGFLKFVDRLESGPYLIWLQNLRVAKIKDAGGLVSASLSITVYAK